MKTRQTTDTRVDFIAGDGLDLHLIHVTGERAPTRGPVLLVHGAGVRGDIFRPPTSETIVDALLAAGYDVWLENWRASIDVAPNPWTLDQAAVYDHPAAVRTVLRETGADTLQAIIHCQGATSFAMSAVAGLIPEVTTIVANAVTLHPHLPWWSQVKIRGLAPFIRQITPHLDPSWGLHAPTMTAKAIRAMVRLTHRECDRDVCRLVSFTYGSGFPALWSHENLDDPTHRWVDHQFGQAPFTFFTQMARCVRAGHLVAVDGFDKLPTSFVAEPPQTDARFALFAGEDNRCFLPSSQQATFRYLDDARPGHHTLHTIPGYGHLDIFMGQHAARDVFPRILDELEH